MSMSVSLLVVQSIGIGAVVPLVRYQLSWEFPVAPKTPPKEKGSLSFSQRTAATTSMTKAANPYQAGCEEPMLHALPVFEASVRL